MGQTTDKTDCINYRSACALNRLPDPALSASTRRSTVVIGGSPRCCAVEAVSARVLAAVQGVTHRRREDSINCPVSRTQASVSPGRASLVKGLTQTWYIPSLELSGG